MATEVKSLKYADLLAVIDGVTAALNKGGKDISPLFDFVNNYGADMPRDLFGIGDFSDWVIEACKRLRIDDGPPWKPKMTVILRKKYKEMADHWAYHRGAGFLALQRFEKEAGDKGVLHWLDRVERQIRRLQTYGRMEDWLCITYGQNRKYQEDVQLALGLKRELLETLCKQDKEWATF